MPRVCLFSFRIVYVQLDLQEIQKCVWCDIFSDSASLTKCIKRNLALLLNQKKLTFLPDALVPCFLTTRWPENFTSLSVFPSMKFCVTHRKLRHGGRNGISPRHAPLIRADVLSVKRVWGYIKDDPLRLYFSLSSASLQQILLWKTIWPSCPSAHHLTNEKNRFKDVSSVTSVRRHSGLSLTADWAQHRVLPWL